MRIAGDIALRWSEKDSVDARRALVNHAVERMMESLKPYDGQEVSVNLMWDASQ